MNQVLCFGDSNTWGYNPYTKGRYPVGVRWTSRLKDKLSGEHINILEEGLCGRTTIYEDETRPGRKGIDSIREIFNDNTNIDGVVIMLGTNDCKTYNNSSAKEIAHGIDDCLDIVLRHVSAENVLLLSPIHLGEKVWQEGYDTEFNKKSVVISKALKYEYKKVARRRGVHFLSASDYAVPSKVDQEHLNESGHRKLADIIYKKLIQMNSVTYQQNYKLKIT
ncbi:MAG: arylesterase [Lachnospiraceae bacterium]|nr:arylesterase [Lachnospiraceae bacterium]